MIDQSFTVDTLQKLVRINSVNPGLESDGAGEEEVGRYIFSLLEELGIEVELDELLPGRFNVTGMLPGSGGGRSLMLNAHMDTVGVAGMNDPFSGRIENGKLYGRGSYDMKGSIAAILAAGKAIRDTGWVPKGDLILSFVVDEEHKSIGAQALVKKLKTDASIVTEPTGLDICLAHRGFGVYKLTTYGKTAHGGRHRQGIDANTRMGLLLAELDKLSKKLPEWKKHPLCGEASMHVPLISGGRSLFIYSGECTIHVERRTVPGETETEIDSNLHEIIQKLEKKVPGFRATLEKVIWRSPYEIDQHARIVKETAAVVATTLGSKPAFIGHTWWEDSSIFGEAGIESVIIGPKGDGIHEDVEWVDIDSVITLAEILYRTSLNFCG